MKDTKKREPTAKMARALQDLTGSPDLGQLAEGYKTVDCCLVDGHRASTGSSRTAKMRTKCHKPKNRGRGKNPNWNPTSDNPTGSCYADRQRVGSHVVGR